MWNEGNNTNVTDPQPDSARTTERSTVTIDELKEQLQEIKSFEEEKFQEQSGKIKSLENSQSGKLDKIQNDLNALAAKHKQDAWDEFFARLSIASSALAFFSIWLALYYGWKQKRDSAEQKSATRQNMEASYLAKQSLQEQKAIIRANRTKSTMASDPKANRSERIGAFPDMYYYISDRIQNTKGPVVITMPFYLFGVLGSPHGLHDFHHTLHELFGVAAGGDEKRKLIVITYDKDRRCVLADRRYSRAARGMETLDDTPQSQKLEDILSKEVWNNLLEKLKIFRKILDDYAGSREILEDLEKKQEELFRDKNLKPEDRAIMDGIKEEQKKLQGRQDPHAEDSMFLKYLERRAFSLEDYFKHRTQIILFTALLEARTAFSEAIKEQEDIYSKENTWNGTETPWTKNATIIELPYNKLKEIGKTFNNEITVYAGGEIMHGTSSLNPARNARNNRLISQSGNAMINYYSTELTALFAMAGQKMPDFIMEALQRDLTNMRANEDLPNTKSTGDWPGMPISEI